MMWIEEGEGKGEGEGGECLGFFVVKCYIDPQDIDE